MYISKLTLRPKAALRFMSGKLREGVYAEHRLLWAAFSDDPERKRDFVYARQDEAAFPTFLAVSERIPDPVRPDLWDIQTKDYAPALRPGETLFFSLRVNPVRTIKNAAGRHKRVDVVMDAKQRLRDSGLPESEWPVRAQYIREAGLAWLTSRAESLGFAFEPGNVDVGRHMRLDFPRKGHEVVISTLDFNGVLTVTDAERLGSALFQGVGHAKGFGCGLLLVRRM